MKKTFLFPLILILILLAACAGGELAVPTDSPEAVGASPDTEEAPGPAADATSKPTEEATPEPAVPTVSVGPVTEDWEGIFIEFLETNYDKLYEAFFGGITGIGFIDLDLDGSAELILFDAGASAAMGVQIFDIADGEVVLVSANMLPVAEAYAGDYYSAVSVNTNSYADFRLMEDDATGLRFIAVESGNGALDFSYTELIVFERSEAAVVPRSLYYKYVETNEEGAVTSARYEESGKSVSEYSYSSGIASFRAKNMDTGFNAAGVFIWENADYYNGFDGFMAMASAAALCFVSSFGFAP